MKTKIAIGYLLSLCIMLTASAEERFSIEQTGRLYNRWLGIKDAVVGEERLFVASSSGGLQIFDISDPQVIAPVGSYTDGSIVGIAERGEVVFLLVNNRYLSLDVSELVAINVRDPRNPEVLSRVRLPAAPVWIKLEGNIAYIDCYSYEMGSTLLVIDVTDPANPQEIGWKSPFRLYNFTAVGDMAYLSSDSYLLYRFNITNPARILFDTYRYLPNGIGNYFTLNYDSNRLYCAGNDVLVSLDVSDPDTMLLLDTLEADFDRGMAIVNGFGYIVDNDSMLTAINLTNPDQMGFSDISRISYLPTNRPLSNGEALFLPRLRNRNSNSARGYRLERYSVDNPQRPQLTASYTNFGAISGIANSGNTVYVTDECNGVRIIDCSDSDNPTETDTIAFASDVEAVFVFDRLLFIRDVASRLHIYTIDDPLNPDFVGRFIWHSDIEPLALRGTTLLAQSGTEGFIQIDMSNPGRPRVLNRDEIGLGASKAVVSGNRLFLLYSAPRLDIYDISDLENIVQLNESSPQLDREVRSMVVKDDLVVLSRYATYLYFIDVSNPREPVEVAHSTYQGICQQIAFHGHDLLIAHNGAMALLDISDLNNIEVLAKSRQNVSVTQMLHLDDGTILTAELSSLGVFKIRERDFPLRWASFPDTIVSVTELDTIALTISAVDRDNRDVAISHTGELPAGASFIDNGDGTANFSWIPEIGQYGKLAIQFRAGAGEETLESHLAIRVDPFQTKPVWTSFPDDTLYVASDDTLEVMMAAEDYGRDLHFGMNDNGLPESMVFRSYYDNTCRFFWVPTVWEAGTYLVVIRAVGTYGTCYDTLLVVAGRGASVGGTQEPLPMEFSISGGYPNPFNSTVSIRYQTPLSGVVALKVFDIDGREVATLVNRNLEAGYHQVIWKPEGESSGVYFCRMEAAAGFSKSVKLLLIK